jgi:hypothetical protein
MTKQHTLRRALGAIGLGGSLCLLGLAFAGCAKPLPRTFTQFMEDRIAMEGVLARCNQNRDETQDDLECANARRAAMAIALREERERREELERESERKLAALRAEFERRERVAREAVAEAEAAKLAAYEAQWERKGTDPAAMPDSTTPDSMTPDSTTPDVAAPEGLGSAPVTPAPVEPTPAGSLDAPVPGGGATPVVAPAQASEASALPRPFKNPAE